VDRGSPYRGLAPFEDSELDALYFFGRERDTEIVVANLIASRLTVLYGPSGVGKSSLLLATVSRAVRSLPEAPIVVVFSSWTGDPARALADALADAAGVERGALAEVAAHAQADRDVYLVLDQAEEYFTYHAEDDGFDEALASLVDGPLRVNVLLSLREDTLATLDRLKGAIPNLFGNVLRLDRLDRDAGRAAIVKPLDRWRELEGEAVTIEDELVTAVLDGVGTGRIELGPGGQGAAETNGRAPGIEAPYLQLVMQRLWEVERASGSATLRAATLVELGGAGQVVADHLERAIEALTAPQRAIAALLFDHLVTPSGMKIAHQASDLAQFAGTSEAEIASVTATLASHRILRTDESGRWEIFHDVLAGAVLGWKGRYEAEQAVERTRDEARRRHRRLGLLALGALAGLVVAGALTVWAFTERDRAQQRAAEARAHELEARAVTLVPTDTSLALVLAAEAARTTPSVTAEDVLRQALIVDRLLFVVPADGPVVDVAPGTDGSFFAATSRGVARRYDVEGSVARRPEPDLVVRYPAAVTHVGADPLGMLSASLDGDARLTVGTASRRDGLLLRGREPVAALATTECRSGSGCIVTGSGSRVWIWDRGDGRRLGSVAVAGRVAELVPWSATSVAVRTRRGDVVVVDTTTQRVVRSLRTPEPVDSLAADPGGRLLAAGLHDGSVFVWRTTTGELETRYRPHLASVLAIDIANGVILSGAAGGAAVVRDLETGRTIALPGGHGNVIRAAELSADGTFAVTASADQTAKVWETDDGRLISVLAGHGDVVTDATFVDGVAHVVTGGLDGTVRVWRSGALPELIVSRGAPPAAPAREARARTGALARAVDNLVVLRTAAGETKTLQGHRDDVNSVAFSADGSLLVSSSRDHDARIWDAETGLMVHQLVGHFGSVGDARFSPDGRWVVTAGPITAGLWNARTGDLVMYLRGPTERPVAAAFGQDSRTIVTQEKNGDVRRYRCVLCGTVDELREIAEQRLAQTGRTVTAEERARYLR
jgi:WD40 repeat protein